MSLDNALAAFDAKATCDTDTIGRWLRDERRPSKPHLQLLVQYFQARKLVGKSAARDRIFIRIAAFYANFDNEPPLPAIVSRHSHRQPGMNFGKLRFGYMRAIALAADLETPDAEWNRFDRYLFGSPPKPPVRKPKPLPDPRPVSVAPSLPLSPSAKPRLWRRIAAALVRYVVRRPAAEH